MTRAPGKQLQLDPDMAKEHPLRILVAEDNLVNQQLAVQLLRRLGYQGDVVGNGLEVLDALTRQCYDVVLMDVNMPEMDGLTATGRILELWPPGSRPRIVAMTANAMQGDCAARTLRDWDKCLNAGMDDYITKPIPVEQLVRALWQCQAIALRARSAIGAKGQQILPRDSVPNGESGSEPDPISEAAIDPQVLQTFRDTMGDGAMCDAQCVSRRRSPVRAAHIARAEHIVWELLTVLIDTYIEESPNLLQRMREAIAQADPAAMGFAAHALKSSRATLGAINLSQMCQQLDRLGQSQTTIDASGIVTD